MLHVVQILQPSNQVVVQITPQWLRYLVLCHPRRFALFLSFGACDDDLDGTISLLLGSLEGRQCLLQLVAVRNQWLHIHLARGN